MRALVVALSVGALAMLSAAPSSAQLAAPPLSAQNAEFVKNFAQHTDAAGGRLVGHYFYITTERDLTIYDVTTPENPVQVGHLDFPQPNAAQNYNYPNEDPDTNGKILLTSSEGAVEVIDVSDKTNPHFIAKLAGRSQHTISCILDCTWAYGSDGSILDLRDPASPKLAGNWSAGKFIDSRHDVTEVAPGYVLTSSQPMKLLDARNDPANPTVVATISRTDQRFNHASLWPNQMQDDIALVGGEASGQNCDEDVSAAFQTYSTADWQTTHTFTPLDEFRLDKGLPLNGRMPNSSYCVHWFSTHPTYRNGGMVSIAWYEQGTRFLHISRSGKITEVGWYLPLGANASAAYWITDRIVYIADYNRGLDIVRYTGPIAPGEPAAGS